MLDINFIREYKNIVKKAAIDKGYSIDIDKLIRVDNKRRELIKRIESLRVEQNKLTRGLKGKPDRITIEKSRELKIKLEKLEPELAEIEKEYSKIMLLVPNIPSKDTPVGKDESKNKEIRRWGKVPKFTFPIKDHVELGEKNDILDIERGVKIGGTRSYILKNELALLEQAVLRLGLDIVRKEGFSIMNVPVIVNEEVLIGSGFFPFQKEDIYKIDDKYLVGTSEASLVYYYANETLQEHRLPCLLSGITTCFRKEAGTYGRDTRGIFRVHQFNKVEQVVLCKEEDAEKMFNFILDISEKIIKALSLPYRVVQMCTGEMGAKNIKQVDIEVWFPAQNRYRETHSCSYLGDFQARRANIKYIDNSGEKHFVHTLNNTAVATPRILGAILENYQKKDGSIQVPKILQSYMGIEKISNTKL